VPTWGEGKRKKASSLLLPLHWQGGEKKRRCCVLLLLSKEGGGKKRRMTLVPCRRGKRGREGPKKEKKSLLRFLSAGGERLPFPMASREGKGGKFRKKKKSRPFHLRSVGGKGRKKRKSRYTCCFGKEKEKKGGQEGGSSFLIMSGGKRKRGGSSTAVIVLAERGKGKKGGGPEVRGEKGRRSPQFGICYPFFRRGGGGKKTCDFLVSGKGGCGSRREKGKAAFLPGGKKGGKGKGRIRQGVTIGGGGGSIGKEILLFSVPRKGKGKRGNGGHIY